MSEEKINDIEIIDCETPELVPEKVEKINVQAQKQDKIKILWISDKWDLNTGFAKCCREFCSRLAMDPDFVVIHIPKYTERPAENIFQMTYQDVRYKFGIIPPLYKKHDQLQNTFQFIINTLRPEFVVVQDDHFVMSRDGFHTLQFPPETISICYVASDGKTIATTGMQALDKVDFIVPMTYYGKKVMEEGGFKHKTVEPIYHGIDSNLWKPLTEDTQKQFLKKHISDFFSKGYNKQIDLTNKFIVYMCGRNSPRKNHPRGIEAFAKFAKGKDDVMMIIHAIAFNATDYHLPDYIERIVPLQLGEEHRNLKEKILFTPPISFEESLTEGQMVQLMQMADCYLSSSNGESFGMTISECLAVGTPAICNNYTTSEEFLEQPLLLEEGIIGPRGLLVNIKDEIHVGMGVVHGLMDTDEGAAKIELLYQDWKNNNCKLGKELGKNGVKFASMHTWDIETEKWKALFKKLKPVQEIQLTRFNVSNRK